MRAWHSSWVDRLGFFLGWEADGWWLTAHRYRSLSLISAHRSQYHLDLSLRQPGKQSSFQNIKDYRERLCHVLVWSLPRISAQLPASTPAQHTRELIFYLLCSGWTSNCFSWKCDFYLWHCSCTWTYWCFSCWLHPTTSCYWKSVTIVSGSGKSNNHKNDV